MARQYKFSTAVNKVRKNNNDSGISSFDEAVETIRANRQNTNYLTEIDRENRHKAFEESQRQARQRAIELARTGSSSNANAGDNRTTAYNRPQSMSVYGGLGTMPNFQTQGMNTAANGADIDYTTVNQNANKGWKGLSALNGSRASKKTISQEESLAHATEVMKPYENNTKAMEILREYSDLEDSQDRSGMLNFQSIGAYSGNFDKLANQFIEETGVSMDEFRKIAENYSYLKHNEQREEAKAKKKEQNAAVNLAQGVGEAATSVVTNYQGLIGAMQNPNDPELGRDYNSPFMRHLNAQEDAKEAFEAKTENLSPVAKTLANLGYDLAVTGTQSAAAALTGEVGLGSFAAGGYASNLEESDERGLTEGQAQVYSAVSGGLEYITERLPIEHLKKIYNGSAIGKSAAGSLKPYIKAALEQMGEEASEELINGIADTVADGLINGDKSRVNTAIQNNINSGMSEDEATKSAYLDIVKDTGYSMLVAALSTGVSAGPALATQAIETTRAGRNIADYENKTGNLTRNVENEVYIPAERENYTSEEAFNQAQETRQAILDASELVADNKRIPGRQARALYESYATTAENLKNRPQATQENQKVQEAQAEIEEQKPTKSYEEIKEDIEFASTPYQLAQAIDQVTEETDEIKELIEYKRQELEMYNFKSSDVDNAVTEKKAFEMGQNGEEITEEQLNSIPEADRAKVLEANNRAYNKAILAEHPEAVADTKTGKYFVPAEIKVDGADVVIVDNEGNEHTDYSNPRINQALSVATLTSKDARGHLTSESMYRSTPQQAAYAISLAIKSPEATSALIRTAVEAIYNSASVGHTSFEEFEKNSKGLFTKVDRDEARFLYNAIAEDARKSDSRKTENTAGKKTSDKAVSDTLREALPEETAALLEALSEKIGYNFVASTNKNARGSINPGTRQISIGTNSVDEVWSIVAHEAIGEYLQAHGNEADVLAIQDDMFKYLEGKLGSDAFNDLINQYQSVYRTGAKEGSVDYGKSRRAAANEMFNDTIFALLSSEEGVKDYVSWLDSNHEKSFFEKVKDFFSKIVQSIRDYIDNGSFNAAERAALEMDYNQAKAMRDRIFKAMDAAIANNSTESINDIETDRSSKKVTLSDGRNVEYLADVLTHTEYNRLKEMIDSGYPAFNSSEGDAVYRLDNKLVYARGKENFGISKIVVANVQNDEAATYILDWYTDVEKGLISDDQASTIIERVLSKEAVSKYTNESFGKVSRYDRPTKRGKSRSDAYYAQREQNRRRVYIKDGEVVNSSDIENDVRHSFAGIGAETADKEQLKKAQELQKKGMGDVTILETTGWFLGMDNKWKFEIPDNDIEIFKEGNREYVKNNPDFKRYLELENKILFTDSDYTEEEYNELMRLDEVVTSDEYYKTKRYGKLSDFIQHDELFRSYPWMEKVDVMFVPMDSDKEKGYADPEDLVIALNLKFQTDVSWNKDALKSTLLHEIQHIIQGYEGFAGGSNPEWWANIRDERIERDQLNIKGAKEHLQKFVDKAKSEGKPASTGEFVEQSVKRVSNPNDSYNMEDHWAAVADWKATSSIYHYENMISKLERHIDRLLSESDIELYYNSAGEIEARDTSNRANLTREQRLEEFPKINARDVVYPKGTVMDRRYSKKIGDIEQKAIEHFGTTDSFRVAGYMLTDGTLLDFSGAHWLEGESPEYIAKWKSQNDIRQVDHEDIYEVMEASGDNRKQFMDRGNIRLNPEAPGFNLSTKTEPTAAQYRELKEFIREIKKNPYYDASRFYVDIEDTHPNKISYANNLNEDRIINDIKKFYETGELPQESSLNDFRYSKRVDSEGSELTEEQANLFKDSKAVDENGNLVVLYHGSVSDEKFTEFNLDAKGSVNGRVLGDGFYFTPDRNAAKKWSRGHNNIYKVYLNITNPYYASADNETPENVLNYLREHNSNLFDKLSKDPKWWGNKKGKEAFINDALERANNAESALTWIDDKTEVLKSLGYDGIIYKDSKKNFKLMGGEQYVAFYPQQIKKTTNKKPTESADIRKSIKVDWDNKNTYKLPDRTYEDDIFFLGTDEEIEAAEKQDITAKAYVANIIHSKDFAGLMFKDSIGIDRLLTRSTRKEWDWQLSESRDGEPIGHENYKEENDDITSYDTWPDKTMAALYNEIINELPKSDARIYVIREGIAEDARNSIKVYGEASPYADSINETKVISTMLGSMNNSLSQVDAFTVSNEAYMQIEKSILKKYNAQLEEGELAANVSFAFAYMQQNKLETNYEKMMNYLLNIGDEVIKNSSLKDPESEQLYNEAKEIVKKYTFKLSEADRNEIKNAFGGNWKTAFGELQKAGIKLNNDKGVDIDTVFSQLQSELLQSAGINLDKYDKPSEQILGILDAMHALEPTAYLWDGANSMDKALTVVSDIINDYYSIATGQLASNVVKGTKKGKETVAAAINKEKDKLNQRFRDYKAEKTDEFNQIVAEKNRIIQEQQNQIKQQNEQMKKWNAELSAKEKQIQQAKVLTEKQIRQTAKLQAREAVESYRQREERAKQIENIKKTGIRLIKWLNNPTDNQHVPAFLQKPLGEFLAAIDFLPKNAKADSKSTLTWQQRMQSLRQTLVKIKDAEAEADGSVEAYFAENMIAKELISMMDDFLGRETWDEFTQSYIVTKRAASKVSLLDAKDLATLNKIMSALSASINNMNKTYANSVFKEVSKLAESSVKEVDALPDKKDQQRMLGKVFNFLNFDEIEPITYFEGLGSGAKSIYQELRDGFNLKTKHVREADAYMDAAKKELGISDKELSTWKNQLHKFELVEGTVMLNTTQIMSLYKILGRKQGKPHVAVGGIKSADFEYKDGKIMKKHHQAKAVHISASEARAMIDSLTPEQIALADKMQQFMANDCAKWGNRVTEKMFGYKKYEEEDYFPLKTDAHSRATTASSDNNVSYYTIKNSSFTKPITPMANNAVVLEDIFDVFTDHVVSMADYDAYVMPIADAMRWFNYSERVINAVAPDELNEQGARVDYIGNMQESIDRVYGDAGLNYFRQFIKDINGDYAGKGGQSEILSSLMSMYKAQAVGANMRVVIQQPTAVVRASDVIEPKYLIEAMGSLPKAMEYAKKAQANSEIAYWKAQGYYETYLGQSFKEIITGDVTLKDKFNDWSGLLAGKADDLSWGIMYRAAELKVAKEQPELKGSAFDKAATKIFEDIVDHTQVVDTIFHKSQYMRNQGAGHKATSAFMAEPTKTYNMLYRAYRDAKLSGNRSYAVKRLRNVALIFLFEQLLNAMITGAWDMLRDDEKEDYISSFKKNFSENAVDNLNPLNLFPMAKEVSSALQGYDATSYFVDAIYTTVDSFNAIVKIAQGKSNKTTWGNTYQIAKAASQLTGVPVANVMREFKTIYNLVNDFWGGKDLINSKTTQKKVEKTKETNRLSKVFEAGDLGSIKSEITNTYNNAIADGKEESEAWKATRDMLKSQYQIMVEANPDDKAAINNRFKTLLKYTKKADGKGGYRLPSDKEIANWIEGWNEASE